MRPKYAFPLALAGIVTLAAVAVFGFGYSPLDHLNAGMIMAEGAVVASAADVKAMADKLAEITGQFKAKCKELESERSTVFELQARMSGIEQEFARRPGGGGGGPAGNSLGAALTRHPDFNSLAELAETRGKRTLQVKAMITSLPDSGGALVPPDVRTDPIMMARRRMTVRNLIAPGRTTSNAVGFVRQTVRDLNAAVTSEGVKKPESNVAFEPDTATVVTLPTWTKASRQILADAPALAATVDGELRYAVALTEETEMLMGDGTGIHCEGIVPQAQTFDTSLLNGIASLQRYDVLRAAITQVERALLPCTGFVLNDVDLAQLATIKDGEGRYIGGGPFGPRITTIWGIPAVGTPAMAAGTFLAGGFYDGAQVWDREDVNVMIATENEDDFLRNLATILCEERFAFAVKRPQAFVSGTFPEISG